MMRALRAMKDSSVRVARGRDVRTRRHECRTAFPGPLQGGRHSCLWRRMRMAPIIGSIHMRPLIVILASAALVMHTAVIAQHSSAPMAQLSATTEDDPVAFLVSRLDLERYKSTIKALTQFG